MRYLYTHQDQEEMIRLATSLTAFLFFITAAHAQRPAPAIASTRMPLSQVEQAIMPPVDNEALLEAERKRRGPGMAPRFAEAIPVDIRPEEHGNWERLPDGTEVWRLRIRSEGAHSLNFGFLEYYMPPGGSLLLYSPDKTQVWGPFTPSDNEPHNELWTPILEGSEAVLEVQLPPENRQQLRLRLATVNHDFLGFSQLLSGACHLDVQCSAADGWPITEPYREAIQSVAVYGLGGDTFCTGFLINNTRNDCTPYFMTAYHCEVRPNNAASVVVYWNYENSYCRQPGSAESGNEGDGNLGTFNTGAFYRAGYEGTDFALLELDDPLSNASQAYFAGWTREASAPTDTIAVIHHPNGREKRISISFQDSYPGAWGNGSVEVPGGNYLIVPFWDIGSTEAGSSGAPLFDRMMHVAGQLRGGGASCGNSQYDAFGSIRYSWTGGGSSSSRLKDWLDPDNSNLIFLDGHWLSDCNATVEVESHQQKACIPGTAEYVVRPSDAFLAPVTLSTAGLPTGATAAFQPNPVMPGMASRLILSLSGMSPSDGDYTFTIRADDGISGIKETEAQISLVSQPPQAPQFLLPEEGEAGLALAPEFIWSNSSLASFYELQLARDEGFEDITAATTGIAGNSFDGFILAPQSTYYCRVRAHNVCGAGAWSAVLQLSTAAQSCGRLSATDTPQEISATGSSIAISRIEVTEKGAVAGIALKNIGISHSFVGDLSAFLRSPSGTVVQLFDRPGVPDYFYGCWGSGLRLSFDDEALLGQEELETTCGEEQPAIQGTFRPLGTFSDLVGEPAAGIWELTVIDNFNQDGGQLEHWELQLCTTFPNTPEAFLLPGGSQACQGQHYGTEVYLGTGFEGAVTLRLAGAPAGVGHQFTPNPALPGTFSTLRLEALPEAGGIPLTITASDGMQEDTVLLPLEVNTSPSRPSLLSPADGGRLFNEQPHFSWGPVSGADTFLIQIASEPSFQDVIRQEKVTEASYFPENLPSGEYFWKVQAINPCGVGESPAFSFILDGVPTASTATSRSPALRVFPNPAQEKIVVEWELGKGEDIQASLYFPDGRAALQQVFQNSTTLPVGHLPPGTYLLQLRAGRQLALRRLVVW